MSQPDELDLRSQFEAQRREDAAAARGFASTVAQARRRPSGRGVHAPFTTAAAAAVTVAVVIAIAVRALGPGEGRPRIDLAATRWTGPTDFLLEVPGAALLRSTPSLDPAGAIISDFQWRTP